MLKYNPDKYEQDKVQICESIDPIRRIQYSKEIDVLNAISEKEKKKHILLKEIENLTKYEQDKRKDDKTYKAKVNKINESMKFRQQPIQNQIILYERYLTKYDENSDSDSDAVDSYIQKKLKEIEILQEAIEARRKKYKVAKINKQKKLESHKEKLVELQIQLQQTFADRDESIANIDQEEDLSLESKPLYTKKLQLATLESEIKQLDELFKEIGNEFARINAKQNSQLQKVNEKWGVTADDLIPSLPREKKQVKKVVSIQKPVINPYPIEDSNTFESLDNSE